jgi:phosphoribosylanthranilate isomerase
MTWVKICGTTNLRDARLAVDAGADAIGFVFAPSPRRVTPGQAGKIVRALPEAVEKVGVFVNQSEDKIVQAVRVAQLTALQLHGDESLDFARHLKAHLPGTKIFRALPFQRLANGASGPELDPDLFYGLLVDGAAMGKRGGTGVSFDWQHAQARLSGVRLQKIVVAGGLTAENVARPIGALHPWGVDVVSGVESAPGRKDEHKVRAFVQAVRACEGRM